jgi:hypothetical protein
MENEQSGDGNGGDATDEIDYAARFLAELRVELESIAQRLGELEERLPWATVAERRSLCFRISEYLEVLGDKATDAAGVTRDHVAALTMHLSRR